MRRVLISTFALLVIGVAPPWADGAAGEATTTAMDAELSLLKALPDANLAGTYNLLRAQSVSPGQAQVLFACATAAVYLWDRGEVWLLSSQDPVRFANDAEQLASALGKAGFRADAEHMGVVTLPELIERVREAHPDLARSGARRYVAMLPAHRHGPVTDRPPAGASQPLRSKSTILSEGFESDPWARWDREDNSGGSYMWGTTTCDHHGGSYSADAVRGGTLGAALSCTDSYSNDLVTSIADSQCEDLAGASQAWLDLYMTTVTEAGFDGFGILYDDGVEYWGYVFSGTFSGWWHVIYNLKQWYGIGDLTQQSCNRLMIVFLTDYSITPGFGLRVDDITVRTGALSGLSCSGSASPTSGQAPLAVTFTGTVSGASGSAETYWYFDDGGSSTQVSTTHTYTSAGEYFPMFEVEDGSAVCAATLEVSVTAPCDLSCGASVPSSGEVGTPVSFQGWSSTSNCSGAVSYLWDFGDGSSSTSEDPTHAFSAPGTYSWSMVASADGDTCTDSGSITIAGVPTSTYLVPGVAHAPGAGGTHWRTKLSVLNRSGSSVQVTLDYVLTASVESQAISLSDGEQRAWDDVAVDLFGLTGDSAGAVVVTSSRALTVAARTYNLGSLGTYGQYLPGVDESESLTTGDTGVISMLCKNSSFRTNVGFVNLGTSSCQVEVTLHERLGSTIGSPRIVAVPARGWKQDNDIFASSGAGTCDNGYATVEVLTTGCAVWGYGSVVDNATGDPTTVPIGGGSGAVQGVTSVSGALDSSSPVWGRIYASGYSSTCNLSATDAGSDSQYFAAYEVRVSAPETLTAEIATSGTSISDTVLALYCDPFDSDQPGYNLMSYDDDGGSGLLSAFTLSDGVTLQPGSRYWLVVSTFGGYATGTYTLNLTSATARIVSGGR